MEKEIAILQSMKILLEKPGVWVNRCPNNPEEYCFFTAFLCAAQMREFLSVSETINNVENKLKSLLLARYNIRSSPVRPINPLIQFNDMPKRTLYQVLEVIDWAIESFEYGERLNGSSKK